MSLGVKGLTCNNMAAISLKSVSDNQHACQGGETPK